jgi:hypothetical protein
LFVALLLGSVLTFIAPLSASAQTRFLTLDVFVDSGTAPLAAYQLEVHDGMGVAKLVGVEGGEVGVFQSPPHYDPRALQAERVVLAAFSTAKADGLPRGRARVATLHYQVTGEAAPRFEVKLQTAATANGGKISAKPTIEERKAP